MILPVGLWGIATVYLPILGGTLTSFRSWSITILIALLIALSLICHALGHLLAARWLKVEAPERISVFFLEMLLKEEAIAFLQSLPQKQVLYHPFY